MRTSDHPEALPVEDGNPADEPVPATPEADHTGDFPDFYVGSGRRSRRSGGR